MNHAPPAAAPRPATARTDSTAGWPAAERRERIEWALDTCPAKARAVLQLRRAGRGAAAHGHAQRSRPAGGGDRHRLPVPRDLPLHRRAERAALAQPAGLPPADRRRPGWKRATAAVGAGPRRHRALQPPAQGRADAARPARARRRHLDRRPAPQPVAQPRSIDFLERKDGRWKLHPIADWSDRDVGAT
jgi:hypothetical protein